MGIKLQKGQRVAVSLEKVGVGLGWEANVATGPEYDLDASAFLCRADGKVHNFGQKQLVGVDVVFYNSLKHRSGPIGLTGDNRTGAGDGDDEQIIVNYPGT